MISEEERIEDVDPLSSVECRLNSSGAKVIPKSQIHVLGERRRWIVRNEDDSGPNIIFSPSVSLPTFATYPRIS